VRALAWRASCAAKWRTPPAAPAISVLWPRCTTPRSNSACHAVSPATGLAAACSWLTPEGLCAITSTGAVAISA